MTRRTVVPSFILAIAALAACDAPPPTAGAPPEAEAGGLDFSVPDVGPDDLILRHPVAPPGSAARSPGDSQPGEPPPGDGGAMPLPIGRVEIGDELEPVAEIYNAKTRSWIENGEAFAVGSHDIRGHGAKVETTLELWHAGRSLGSQTAVTQKLWLFSLATYRHISAWAAIVLDVQCDVSVRAYSRHHAWIELLWGITAEISSARVETTTAPGFSTAACARAGGSGELEMTDEDTGMTCYYLITYDLESLEIIDAELLYCTTSGDPQI